MSNTTQALSRIEAILDDSSFVEIGAGVTARSTDFNIQEKKAPSDGVITGYGVINGNLVYVYSQDATVLNGSIGEMHAKKISALYDYAMKMGAPVIGLIDCAGLRLQEATDALEGFGTIYTSNFFRRCEYPYIEFPSSYGYNRRFLQYTGICFLSQSGIKSFPPEFF